MPAITNPQEPSRDSSTADTREVKHFEFGRNWSSFLTRLTDQRIESATHSVQRLLKCDKLIGKRFLDAGCGSGLFSLVATRLGASVTSFDFDEDSVQCAQQLRSIYGGSVTSWEICRGSLLDQEFMRSLGTFDVVYCWGVAHHTGSMWQAIEWLAPTVRNEGQLVVAIYNDQEYISRGWSLIKSIYQRLPAILKPIYVAIIGTYWPLKRILTTLIACVLRLITLRNPLVPLICWLNELRHPAIDQRGMDWWIDLKDWVGGWPFEVAKPEDVFRFLRDRGFVLEELITRGGHGCNEFVFRKRPNP